MRLSRTLVLVGALSLAAVSCDTAEEVRGGVEGARNSAASVVA